MGFPACASRYSVIALVLLIDPFHALPIKFNPFELLSGINAVAAVPAVATNPSPLDCLRDDDKLAVNDVPVKVLPVTVPALMGPESNPPFTPKI